MACGCSSCRPSPWLPPRPPSLLAAAAAALVTALSCRAVASLTSSHAPCWQHCCGVECREGRGRRVVEVGAHLAAHLRTFLPGGPASRELRQRLLRVLATAPMDPRVQGGREAVTCALLAPEVEELEVEGIGPTRYLGTSSETAITADLSLVMAGLEGMKSSRLRVLAVSSLETAAMEGLSRVVESTALPALSSLTLHFSDSSAFTYRSQQAATRHSYEHARLAAALSTLTSLETLEISQPAVTPDLTLLRLFYPDLAATFPSLTPHDLVQGPIDPPHLSLASLSLDPPSFRTLYDGAAPIIFPSGPVTLQELLPQAAAAATSPLAASLRRLTVRGHSLPLLCPPLVLLACPALRTFRMAGHHQGSSRHYTLAAIHNFQENFLLPSLALIVPLRPAASTSSLTSVTLHQPYSGDTVATHDLFSQTVSATSLLPATLAALPALCPRLTHLEVTSQEAITEADHLGHLNLLPNLTHLTLEHTTPSFVATLHTLHLTHLTLTHTSVGLGEVLTACPKLHTLNLHTSCQVCPPHFPHLPHLTSLHFSTWLDASSLSLLLLRCPGLEELVLGPRHPSPSSPSPLLSPTHLLTALRGRGQALAKVDLGPLYTSLPSLPLSWVREVLLSLPHLATLTLQARSFTRHQDTFIEHATTQWLPL